MRNNENNRTISFRLDDKLYTMIANSARNAGITKGEYIRQQLRKGKVVVKQEIIAEVPMLKRVLGELGKIGSNLNQIAHYFNGGGTRSREIYDGLQKAISQIYQMKFEVEKMGGKFRGYSKARIDQKQ